MIFLFYTFDIYIAHKYEPYIIYLQKNNPQTTSFIEKSVRDKKIKKSTNLHWITYDNIPDTFIKSLIIAEDPKFFKHKGFDFKSMRKAFKENLRKMRIVKGASTISQQLAKNLFLSSEKTFKRKIKEFFITRILEKQLSKRRILELYCNVIEYGPNAVYGIGNAAKHFFKKNPKELTTDEIVRLIASLPKASTVSPVMENDWMIERANIILDKLKRANYLTKQKYCNAFRMLNNLE